MIQIPVSSGSSRTCANIAITNDNIVENDEDFRVSFEIPSGTNANAGVLTSTRVVIIDDDSKEKSHSCFIPLNNGHHYGSAFCPLFRGCPFFGGIINSI